MSWRRGDYEVRAGLSPSDLGRVHEQMEAYWKLGTPPEVTRRAFEHSLGFGLYRGQLLVGWARVITDYAVFAYLADVFVVEECRGQGMGRWLVECILEHPELQNLRRWMLSTDDAHGLYAQVGFRPLAAPGRLMERRRPDPDNA
ncbi:MAG: GNAT family N-acetyltransferase [Meiothermus sp.]|nr:GNAT family N-acetyltransferase [Meiothermus sp.]